MLRQSARHASFSPPKSITQNAYRSVQPFYRAHYCDSQTDRHVARSVTVYIYISHLYVRSTAMRPKNTESLTQKVLRKVFTHFEDETKKRHKFNKRTVSVIPRLHDTTGCQTGCQPVWQPCWTNSHCSFNRVERTATVRSTGCQTGLYNRFDNRLYTRYSRLSNRLSCRLSNGLNVCIHDTTGWQTGLTTGCIV